jgi:LemA protein
MGNDVLIILCVLCWWSILAVGVKYFRSRLLTICSIILGGAAGLFLVSFLAGLIGMLIAAALINQMVQSFNRLTTINEQAEAAFNDLEVSRARRQNIVANLVRYTALYSSHEFQTLKTVMNALGTVSGAKVLGLAQRFPKLRANTSYLQLGHELVATEHQISLAANRYNEFVKIYNAQMKRLPDLVFADPLGFHPKKYVTA